MLVKKASFLVTNSSGVESRIVADKAETAAHVFEKSSDPVTQVVREHTVQDFVPDADVYFQTEVAPQGAVAAGCTAAPKGQYHRTAGDRVIFTADPATGWSFGGWYRNDALISSDAEAEIAVEALQAGETVPAVYKALFVPATT
jgi:hypothetical protein